ERCVAVSSAAATAGGRPTGPVAELPNHPRGPPGKHSAPERSPRHPHPDHAAVVVATAAPVVAVTAAAGWAAERIRTGGGPPSRSGASCGSLTRSPCDSGLVYSATAASTRWSARSAAHPAARAAARSTDPWFP